MSETERRPHKAEREAREDRLQARAAGLAPKPLPIATLNMEVWARNDFEEKAVEDYAEAMGAGESFPAGRRLPRRGDQLAGRRSPQGRCRAPRRTYGDPGRGALGRPTRRSAVAIWANARDGVSLTRADRRRAVEGLLRDEEWREGSDRQIARHCGVDHKTVGARPCAAPGQWGNSPSGGRWRRASARRPAGTGRSAGRLAQPFQLLLRPYHLLGRRVRPLRVVATTSSRSASLRAFCQYSRSIML
jgi:hypothetical protein